MSTINECLEIIGLATESQCECGSPPDDASESPSNVFMSQLLDTEMFAGLATCSNGNDFWDGLKLARKTAAQYLASDLFTRLRERGKPARQQFNGAIGRVTGKDYCTTTETYMGVRVFMANVVGGIAELKKIGLYFEKTGTVTVHVFDKFGVELGAYECATLAKKHSVTTLETPLPLPMHDNYSDNLEYFIVYEYDSANRPIRNDTDCGCGSFKPKFNNRQPSFATTTPIHQSWAQWCMVGGFTGDVDDLISVCENVPVTDQIMHGLTLDVSFKCGEQTMLCSHAWDFDSPLDISIALAMNFKAVSIAIEYLLRSPDFNRENLINREILDAARIEYLQEYEKLMPYIAQEFPLEETDCWVCVTPFYIGKIQR